MAQDREPKPFECECRGLQITGTVQYCGYNLRDYWVQFVLGGVQYSFTLIMSGLGAAPRHSVNCFFSDTAPHVRHYINVPTQPTEQAFEAAINAIIDWREQEARRLQGVIEDAPQLRKG